MICDICKKQIILENTVIISETEKLKLCDNCFKEFKNWIKDYKKNILDKLNKE